jgi:gliding motility-associated-like protein
MGLTIADTCTSDATLVVTSADTSVGTCPIVVTRTYTITDACGNFTTATQTINIQDTTAPVVTGTIAPANAEGCAASAAPAAVTTVAALEGMGLTIADACTPDATLVVTSADTSAGTCPIVVTRTYTITDACGNASTATQTINVQDTTAPVVTGTITAANAEGCTASAAPAAVTTVAALEGMGLTIADTCTPDTNLLVTSTDTSAGTCPIVVTRTYTITDTCGNFTTATQTINVQDTTAPVVTGTIAPANAEGCAASAAPAAVTTVAALEGMGLTIADACTPDATLVVTSTDTSAGTCPIVVTRTYTITDACGNFTTATQTINIQDTTAPVVTGTITAANAEGCTASAAPAAVTTVAALEGMGLTIADACTPDATLVVTSADTSAGTCPIVVTRTYTITDACGNFTTATQTINVQDTTAPVVTGTIAPANAEGCAASAAPAAVTTVAVLEGMGLTIADACTPDATLVVTSTDTSAGTCPIVVTRTYTITDACGNASTATQTINVQDTTAPVVTGTITAANAEGCTASAAPAAVTTVAALEGMGLTIADTCTPDTNLLVTSTDTSAGTCPIVVTRTYTITDTCGNFTTATQTINIQDTTAPVVTGTITAANVQGCSAAVAPAAVTTVAALEGMGLTIADACTPDATLVVTSADTSAGTCPIVVTRTYTITDACGNASTINQLFNIQDTTAPVVTGTIVSANAEGCVASAAPAAVTTVAALEGMGLTIADACTTDATLVVTSADTSAGTCPIVVTRTYTITDACGNFTTATQTINVQDTTAPVFVEALPANATVECSAVPTAVVLTATDNCTTAQTVVYTETRTNGSCPNNYTLARVWTATDECGNVVSHTQTLTVQDTTAPVFVEALPADATVECSVVPTAVVLTATDNCTTAQTVVYTETRTNGSCPNNYTLARVWTATDECGNVVSHTQTLTVQDTTAPVFVEALPADATVECSAVPTAVVLTATDNCTTAQTVVYTETRTNGSCPNNYTLARVWTATDACGNVVSHTQTLTVQDTTAPVFVEALPADATVECSAVPTAVVLTATDNCTTAQTVVYTETRTDGSCPNNYTLARVWTATDACGNVVSHTQTLTVQDTTAPVFVEALPADATVECSAVPTAVVLTATDNCTTAQTVVYTETRTDGSCPNNYTLARVWTATDACGNVISHTQTLTVQDTTAPVFVEALPADLVLECSDTIPAAATLTATDNCSTTMTVVFDEQRVDGSCANNYELIRTWTATDECGNETSHTQIIDVQDTTGPVFVEALPADAYANCNGIPVAPELTATDNCGTATVTYTETEVEGDCTNRYSLVREWTATDACGNQTTHTQTVYLACYVTVYNAVSPNGDGSNDVFLIEGIECYPNNSIEVYNRYGVKVYETSGYDNINRVFKGYSEGRSTISSDQLLPTGTYFYILKYEYDLYGTNQQNIEKSGYLYIQSN